MSNLMHVLFLELFERCVDLFHFKKDVWKRKTILEFWHANTHCIGHHIYDYKHGIQNEICV